MALFIIDYDLSNPGQNYDDLIAAIKNYSWAKICKSSWAISTTDSETTIRDNLKSYLDKNDRLFVGKLTGSWAAYGLPTEVTDWLKKH